VGEERGSWGAERGGRGWEEECELDEWWEGSVRGGEGGWGGGEDRMRGWGEEGEKEGGGAGRKWGGWGRGVVR